MEANLGGNVHRSSVSHHSLLESTGIGRLGGEEGIENIERAFLYAGPKSAPASSWAASDIYTADLMDRFYRNLQFGQDEGDALCHAKLDLLKKFRSQAAPFYWAGFTLVGNPSVRVQVNSRKD